MNRSEAERTFHLHAVEPCKAPHPESNGGRWHRYVVKNQLTTIEGYAKGTRKEVTDHANRYIVQLNAKNSGNVKAGPRKLQRRAVVAK